MSGNRFDFLEFPESRRVAESPQESSSGLMPLPGFSGQVDAEGNPLAQVTQTDTRGYLAFIEQIQAEEKQAVAARLLAQQKPTMRPVEVFGKRGIRAGEFNYPTGIAVDSQGVLYVADSYNHRIQRITPDGGVAIIGSRGSARTQFLTPQAVAVDRYDAFYVVEQGNHRVQKFSATGVLELVFGELGQYDGGLNGPTGIAVAHQTGDIIIADTGNSRVQRFDQYGRFLFTLGYGDKGLLSPQSVTLDKNDHLYVVDTLAHRLVWYDPMGRYMNSLGVSTYASAASNILRGRFFEPRACAVDPTGMVYVADSGDAAMEQDVPAGRVQAIEPRSGQTEATVEQIGRGLNCLSRPGGLAIGPGTVTDTLSGLAKHDLYVADTMNHRILRFAWS